MRRHDAFEWDAAKAAENLSKHRVPFEAAASMLADSDGDRFHLELYDLVHSDDEDRWITIGSLPADRSLVLVAAWTLRETVTRIISARKATRQETRDYAQAIKFPNDSNQGR